MLTHDQKEAILRSAGIEVPAWTQDLSKASPGQQEAQGDQPSAHGVKPTGRTLAAKTHALAIDALFDQYVAQRAARGVREADDAMKKESRNHRTPRRRAVIR